MTNMKIMTFFSKLFFYNSWKNNKEFTYLKIALKMDSFSLFRYFKTKS